MNLRTGQRPLLAALILGVAVLTLLWLAEVTSGGEEVPAFGGSYVEGVVGNPERVNPLFAESAVERDLAELVFSGLTRVGPDGTILPDLARSWEITPDGRTYIFELRPRILWHDEEPFTADDVVFTANLLGSPDFAGDPALAAIWRTVEASRVDALTVRFDLEQPFAPFLAATTIGVLPSHLLGDLSVTEVSAATTFNEAPVGTGPFRLESLSSDGAVLDAYRPYHLAPPYLDRVAFRFFETEDDLREALRARAVQGGLLAADGAAAELAGRGYVVDEMTSSAYVVLYLNQRSVLFVDDRVRTAVEAAIDRGSVVADALEGRAIPARSPIVPGSWAWRDSDIAAADPAAAARLMADAGWTLQDGVWSRGSIRMEFNILTNPDPARIAAAESLAQQLRTAGFLASVATVEPDELVADFIRPRRFNAALLAFDPGVDPDPYPAWHSSQSGTDGANIASFVDETTDRLLEDGRQAIFPDARSSLYGEFQERFLELTPSVIVYYPYVTYVVDAGLHRRDTPIFFGRESRFFAIEEWYRNTRRE